MWLSQRGERRSGIWTAEARDAAEQLRMQRATHSVHSGEVAALEEAVKGSPCRSLCVRHPPYALREWLPNLQCEDLCLLTNRDSQTALRTF